MQQTSQGFDMSYSIRHADKYCVAVAFNFYTQPLPLFQTIGIPINYWDTSWELSFSTKNGPVPAEQRRAKKVQVPDFSSEDPISSPKGIEN